MPLIAILPAVERILTVVVSNVIGPSAISGEAAPRRSTHRSVAPQRRAEPSVLQPSAAVSDAQSEACTVVASVQGALTSLLGANYKLQTHRTNHYKRPHGEDQNFHVDGQWRNLDHVAGAPIITLNL